MQAMLHSHTHSLDTVNSFGHSEESDVRLYWS